MCVGGGGGGCRAEVTLAEQSAAAGSGDGHSAPWRRSCQGRPGLQRETGLGARTSFWYSRELGWWMVAGRGRAGGKGGVSCDARLQWPSHSHSPRPSGSQPTPPPPLPPGCVCHPLAMLRPPPARSCSSCSRCSAVVESSPLVGSSSSRIAGLISSSWPGGGGAGAGAVGGGGVGGLDQAAGRRRPARDAQAQQVAWQRGEGQKRAATRRGARRAHGPPCARSGCAAPMDTRLRSPPLMPR